MSKYTIEELQAMCNSYIWRKAQSRDSQAECQFFLQFMSVNTGIHPNRLEAGIQHMAEHGSWE